MKYTHLTIEPVFGDVFSRGPPLGGQVADIAGIQEGIVARVRQEGLKSEGDDRIDGSEEGDDHKDRRDDIASGLAEVDLGDLTGFPGDGGVALAAGQAHLVEHHDRHTEDHHDDRQDGSFTRILRVHRNILGGKCGQAQVMRHRIGPHGGAEHQQNGGKDRRADHRQSHTGHDLPFRRIQDRGRLFQVGIHVLEDAADQNIGKRGVVKSENHQAREKTLTPPFWHRYSEQ